MINKGIPCGQGVSKQMRNSNIAFGKLGWQKLDESSSTGSCQADFVSNRSQRKTLERDDSSGGM